MPDKYAGYPPRGLTELVDFPTGQVDPRRDPFREQILLAPDHVESGTGRVLKYESAAEQGAISGKYVVRPGDVIFSKIRPALRKVVLADFSGTCSADMYPLRCCSELVPQFLLGVLLGSHFSRFVESVSGRTGIPKVNRTDLSSFRFPLPPLKEQRRIIEITEAISVRECAIEAELGKLRTLKSGIVDDLLTCRD